MKMDHHSTLVLELLLLHFDTRELYLAPLWEHIKCASNGHPMDRAVQASHACSAFSVSLDSNISYPNVAL